MKITVVIPSYNQGRFIRRTITSVLSQQGVDLEILVFDAGSKDETLDVLKSFGDAIKWVSEPDRGQTDAINKGLKAATGDIHCYLNSDDVFYPGALRAVVEAFRENPSKRVVYGDADHIDENDGFIEPYYNEDWSYQRLLEVCFICQPATFWRSGVTEEFGLFDDSLNYAMDYDYWLRVGAHEPFFYLKGVKLAGSRMYSDNKTMAFRVPVHKEILKVVRRKTATPYRWLRVLSEIATREEKGAFCKTRYASNIARFSEWYGIPLDGPMLAEIAGMFLAAQDERWSLSRFRNSLQKRISDPRGAFRGTLAKVAVLAGGRMLECVGRSLMHAGGTLKSVTGVEK